MKKYISGLILTTTFTLLMILILYQCSEYNYLSFILGMFSGIFSVILPMVMDNCDN